MMTATLAERACQINGELHERLQALREAAPTADLALLVIELVELEALAREAEQLTDAMQVSIALVVATLRVGVGAKRTRSLERAWRDAEQLEAVRRSSRTPRITRRVK
jgi:hypothetical protein